MVVSAMTPATGKGVRMERRYETRALYATAYTAQNQDKAQTHTVLVIGEDFNIICRRAKTSSVMDDTCATNPDAQPTCPDCLKRDPRFVQVAK